MAGGARGPRKGFWVLKAQAEAERAAWAGALQDAAKQLGYVASSGFGTGPKQPKAVQVLGSIAWGRYEGEPGAVDSKDRAVEAVGYLRGVWDTAMRAARAYGDGAADEILRKVPAVARRRMGE